MYYIGPPEGQTNFRKCVRDNRLSLCWNSLNTLHGNISYIIKAESLAQNMTPTECRIYETSLILESITDECEITFGSQCAPYNYTITPVNRDERGRTSSVLVESRGQ